MAKIKFSFILKLVFVGAILAGISAMVVMKLIFTMSTITMPDFTGIPLKNAENVAQRMGLEIKVEDRIHSNMYKEGHILSQSVKPRSHIKKGRVIHVVLSKGSKMVEVPPLIGLAGSKAALLLKNSDLMEGFKSETTSGIYREGVVMAQSPPAGENVPFNHQINILKSAGPKKPDYMMPGFLGKNISAAYGVLKEKKLFIEELNVKNDEGPESGTILSQDPPPGYKVNMDTPIILTISKRPSDTSLKQRLIRVNHRFTGYRVAKLVKVTVFSLNGSEIIYNKITQPGETISISARVRGDALVQFFVGTELIEEMAFNAPGAGYE